MLPAPRLPRAPPSACQGLIWGSSSSSSSSFSGARRTSRAAPRRQPGHKSARVALRCHSSSSSSTSSSSSSAGSSASSHVATSTAEEEGPPAPRPPSSSSSSSSSSSIGSSGADAQRGPAEEADGDGTQQLRLRVRVITAMDQVPQAEWDALVEAQPEVNPFLRWAFLNALEASGSAAPSEGWGPQHVLVREEGGGALLGAAPLYLKGHSQGEYVFDSSWASYSHMMGKRYYPKLQCCVPFTPATGARLLVRPGPLAGVVFKALAQTLATLTEELGASSLHITFPTGEEWAQLGGLGFQQRRGIQYHFDNRGYATFEDFLADLKQRKRKSIRQERKGVAKQGLAIRRLRGSEVGAAMWDKFFDFYQLTIDKWWGRPYLKREFFHRLGSDMADDEVLLVVADDKAGGDTVAAALNLVGSHCIFGRNWGCAPDTNYKHLHFELCYYQAIEEAIARGLPRVEAGAQGEHKLQRGLLPNFTYSAHYLPDPLLRGAVGKFLEREDSQLQYAWQQLTLEGSPFKQDTTLTHLMDKISSYSSLSSGSSLSSLSSLSSDEDDGEPRGPAAAAAAREAGRDGEESL